VQANILKTLQGMKGPAGRKGVRRSDEPSYRDVVAGRIAEEREREKTRIRVNKFVSAAFYGTWSKANVAVSTTTPLQLFVDSDAP
jgi:hypothetical protein